MKASGSHVVSFNDVAISDETTCNELSWKFSLVSGGAQALYRIAEPVRNPVVTLV
jgi:hypothetical protein